MKSYQKIRIDEVLWMAQESVVQKNPGYEVGIEFDEVSEDDSEMAILGEGTLLRTAFANLMENGCKYSENHRMKVHLDASSNSIVLHFQDTGVGIAPDDLPFIIDTFYRSETNSSYKGYGIGLALTRRIVAIHRGSIKVESSVGSDSDFLVQFPKKL